MVEIDFLAANHVRIVGLCGQNWNRTLGYSFALRCVKAYVRNVVKYLTTVEWTTRPQCMGMACRGHWPLGTSSAQFTVYRIDWGTV